MKFFCTLLSPQVKISWSRGRPSIPVGSELMFHTYPWASAGCHLCYPPARGSTWAFTSFLTCLFMCPLSQLSTTYTPEDRATHCNTDNIYICCQGNGQ